MSAECKTCIRNTTYGPCDKITQPRTGAVEGCPFFLPEEDRLAAIEAKIDMILEGMKTNG